VSYSGRGSKPFNAAVTLAVSLTMRHAQRALLVLVERMFFDEESVTNEDREELDHHRLSAGEVKEVFRIFLRSTFGNDAIDLGERRRLLAIAQTMKLPEELVPSVTLRPAA
jgi:hypothetical protein